MANLSEISRWEAGIYQWETSDPVQGGPNGIDNRPTRELANRTRWLYDELGRVKVRMDEQNFSKASPYPTAKHCLTRIIICKSVLMPQAATSAIKKTNKGIQLKNDGTLQYDGSDIITVRKVSHSPDDYTVATVPSSFALNKAFDNSIKRGGAIGLGGAAHQISIGWDKRGLIAKVDSDILNVGVPTGFILYTSSNIVPFGWLKANGAAVSRTDFAQLFAAIGTSYGAGDGRTTFNLPDLRAEFIRGWDDGKGVDLGRTLGSLQEDQLRSHSHVYRRGHIANTVDWERIEASGDRNATLYDGDGRFDDGGDRVTTAMDGGVETRPRNISLSALIKI